MTNDTKKINELVSENDEDTSELEVLTATAVFDPDFDYEAESDAATHSFEGSEASAGTGDVSIAALKSDLQQRDESIGNLQYDIEELRARWTGLEKELKAREDLTDNVTSELEQSNRKLAQTISLLRKGESKVASLESTLGQQAARLTEADSAIEQARKDADSLQTEIAAQRDRAFTATKTIDSLGAELNDEKSKRKRAEDSEHAQGQRIQQLEAQHDQSRSLLATLQQYIEGRKDSWGRQEADLRIKGRSLEEQRKEVARLAREASGTAEQLHKEQAAGQALQAERDTLQAEFERVRIEVRELTAALSEKDKALGAQQAQIASLIQKFDDAAPALEQEKAHRQSIERQLDEQQQLTSSLRTELTALQDASAEKEALIAEQQKIVDELSRQMEATGSQLAREESQRKDLEKQLQRQQKIAEQLRKDHSELSAEAANNEQLISEQGEHVINLKHDLKSVSNRFEGEQSDRQALALQYETLRDEATQLRAELGPLRVAASKAESLEKVHAELSGLVSSNEDAIKILKDRISKTEGYADVLRVKLQQQLAESETLASGRNEAEASLGAALERVNDLAARLGAEQQLSAELKGKYDDAERRLEQEVRRIRFEMDAAQATIAENQTVNEQLTLNLVESTVFRHALENRLAKADEARDKETRDLSKQLVQLKQQLDDYERKIGNKDTAISALLTELAHKPDTPPENVAADVVHRLADRKPHSTDERGTHEKDRVTRLLLGSIEGQELRFPLFKDKLTIGRTVHNDIQLKAQYVSRRHAVVVTDEDCTRIVDWGSKNGIYVNGKRITEQVLKNGDRVTVGTADFKYEERPKR